MTLLIFLHTIRLQLDDLRDSAALVLQLVGGLRGRVISGWGGRVGGGCSGPHFALVAFFSSS